MSLKLILCKTGKLVLRLQIINKFERGMEVRETEGERESLLNKILA